MSMESDISTAVKTGVRDIAITFLSMDVTAGPTLVRDVNGDYAPPEAETSALILLNGAVQGGLFLSAPEHVAMAMTSALLGETLEEMGEEVYDGFGEVANMVAGSIQTELAVEHGEINLSPPSILGQNGVFEANSREFNHSVRQFFKTPVGPFFVEIFYT
ncbi:putative chemotaxis protein CheX [Magnetococcus marinus MC-1]|uniref:Putative chemotaxis protein CheX n=1 Tax=Magnetococcus marinus (strain ATCC BAA-1437 / JCM 17883 / MC-1) TaxID=156889 RepID=A0L6L7_MAGMM|nr:chemotaxis protein CheX [Magnetococcus marinus]ABK43610.1 putative chemotaxis protein CheX [Magnetococcus marinus MC-1]